MARGVFNIEFKDNRRPCIAAPGPFDSDGEKCFFHCWSMGMAILEFEDGHMEELDPHNFRFVDGGGFEDYAWPEEEKAEEPPVEEEIKGCRYSACRHYTTYKMKCACGNSLAFDKVCKDFEP